VTAAGNTTPGAGKLPAPGAFDSHTHMDIMGLPADGVLAAAREAGISRVVNAGCDLPSSRWGVTCAAEYPDAYAAVAIHPNSTAEVDDRRDEVLAGLAELAASPKVVAIGETGLDYYRDHAAPQVQRWWFRAHIELAQRTGKALMIHDREAAAGYIMSFAGNVTFKNAVALQEAAVAAPSELIVAETDAPYLTPVPHRGKPNSPAMTAHTVRYLAALKGLDLADFCAQLQATGQRVFHW
jgi:TatD DNase family protein